MRQADNSDIITVYYFAAIITLTTRAPLEDDATTTNHVVENKIPKYF